MLLNPYELLLKHRDEASSIELASLPLPEPGEGDELRRFLQQTGRTKLEVWEAVDRYISKMPPAIQGENGSLAIFNIARVLRFGFDLGGNGGWDILCDWNAKNSIPPFDQEAEHGPNSLRKKWYDADKSDHQREPKERGHLLWTNEGLRQPRSLHALGGELNPVEGWKLDAVPLTEFLGQTFPKPERIVGKLLRGAVCLLYGAAGLLKTWLALEIVRQASEANHSVLYVLEEGLPYKVQERMRQMGMDADRVFIAMRQGFILHEPGMLVSLISRAREVKAALIILDPLSNMNEKDENDRQQMLEVWRALQKVANETGACVLVLHHSSKAGSRQGKLDLGADMSNLRGSSVLQGAVDLMWELRRDPKNLQRAEIFTTKNRNETMEVPGSVDSIADPADSIQAHRQLGPWGTSIEAVRGPQGGEGGEEGTAGRGAREADWAILTVVRDEPGCSKAGVIKGLSRALQLLDNRPKDCLAAGYPNPRQSLAPPNYALHVRGEAQPACGKP